ncbi:MAG: hypothetical protein ABIT20_25065 [Gemmatimonadaceae bacterium]
MRDDELDELLRDAASSYNTPPEPPREAMWDAISRARDGAAVVPIGSPRPLPRWIAAAAGVAAVLVAGIVIGRASRGLETVATTTSLAPTLNRDSNLVAQPGSPDVIAAPIESGGTSSGSESRPAPHRVAARAAAPQRGMPRDRANGANDFSNDGAAYRLAVVEHLTRTEVLLTSFRAQERSGEPARIDAQFAALSRELLGTTRLLLTTRRGDDPNITRLLQDLEYVLMQLSQYANDGRRVDLDALNQSMDKRNVIPKLRSNIPAGLTASSGT